MKRDIKPYNLSHHSTLETIPSLQGIYAADQAIPEVQFWGEMVSVWLPLQEMDLVQVYLGIPPGRHTYQLRSMVCFYGAHYHAFLHKGGRWLMFDDATTAVVGAWEDVVHKLKCHLGKIQLSVLHRRAPSS